MYELKKNGKVFTSKFVGTGPSSYKKRIYRAAVSQRLRNTGVEDINSSLGKKLQEFYGTRKLINVFTCPYPEPDESITRLIILFLWYSF